MKYRIVTTKHGVMELTEEQLYPALEVRGHPFTGFNSSTVQREEIRNAPKFEGLAGPMWDGDAVRYEDWETNRILST